MGLVKVDKLTPGAVLAEEVRDANARLLLSKGQALEDKHFRILKMWGVFEVHVQGEDTPSEDRPEPVDGERLAIVAGEIREIFGAVDISHPAVKEVVRLSIEHRMNHFQPPPRPSLRPAAVPTAASQREMLARLDRLDVQLPEVPSLVYELNEIIADPMSSAGDVAQVVNKSPSLTATLLKIVNSAFFGFRSKIDSIPRAIMLIGSKELTSLAMGITIMETFRTIPREVIDVASLLEHNLACGMVARIMAAHGNMIHTEQIFVSGMLHDIGRLVLCKYFPQNARYAFAAAAESGDSLLAAERRVLGCTHVQLGKRLLRKWKLPYALENSVAYHHQPSASPDPEMAVMLQMADMIVHGMGIGHSGENKVPCFDDKAWQRISIPVSAFHALVHQAAHQVETFRDLMRRS
jgi:HD-like signal output (HDOD) protein